MGAEIQLNEVTNIKLLPHLWRERKTVVSYVTKKNSLRQKGHSHRFPLSDKSSVCVLLNTKASIDTKNPHEKWPMDK